MLRYISKFCQYALVAVLTFTFGTQTAFAATLFRYVDASVSISGDGHKWSTPMKYLADAISYLETNMGSGDTGEIHVAGGTYYPDHDNANPSGSNDQSAHFTLLKNVQMLGHFKGLSSSGHEDERDHNIIIQDSHLFPGFCYHPRHDPHCPYRRSRRGPSCDPARQQSPAGVLHQR